MGGLPGRTFLLLAWGLAHLPVPARAAVPGNDTRLQELVSHVRFEPLTRADGISLGTVVQIFQDHRGFLWFGSANGLNRYDGYETVRYTDVPMDHSGPISYPGLLYESRDGSLWVGTQVLSLYQPGTGAVTRFEPPKRVPPSSWPQKISAIHEDTSGSLWLGISDFRLSKEISQPVLYRFEPKTGVSSAFPISSEITHGEPGAIRVIEHDKSGTLWLGTTYGLVRFDPKAGTFTAYPHTHPKPSFSTAYEYTFNSLIWDRDGKLWVHMPAGLERFDPVTGSFDQFRETYFWFMFSGSDGVIWLCGGDVGAKLFDPQSGGMVRISPDDDEQEPDLIAAALRDRAGNVWAYFDRKGLRRYTASFPRFGKVASGRGNPASLPVGSVANFSEDRDGKVWISVLGFGLVRFDPEARSFTRFPYKPGSSSGLPSPYIGSMYEDRAGTFWIGTVQEFGRFDRKSGIYTRAGTLPNNWVSSMFEDRTGRFWVGNMLGPLRLLDRKTGAFTTADVNGGYVSHEDRSGNLWFGYPPGLNRLDAAGKVRSVSLLDRPDGSGPENVMVQTLYEDGDGIFWLATQSGLVRFDPQSEKSTRYGVQNGLADIDVRCALGDGQGSLWLSTASGLSRFDLKEKRFYNYDERDGLQANIFQGRACYEMGDGKMYFGGKNGFNAFYPRDVAAPRAEPPVVLTDLTISGSGAGAEPVANLDVNAVRLTPAQDGFTIGFAALSYGNSAKTRYRFKLEDHEAQWVEADTEHRFARYTSVPPGRYVFRVQAFIDGKGWEHNEASLHLTLAPPWWKTPWSKAAALLAIAALIFGAHQSRVKILEAKERHLKNLVEQRTAELVEARDQAQIANRAKGAFLAHMSHELRNPLSSILGISDLLRETEPSEEQRGYLDLIDRSSDHLLTLIDNVLDLAKIEAGKHDVIAAPCDPAALAHEVTEIMRVKAVSKKLSLVALPAPALHPCVLTDAPKLRQVLINLLSNAIKFTDSGSVALRVSTIGQDNDGDLKLRFEVEDTGVGIAPEEQTRIFEPFVQVGRPAGQKGTGLGLTITRQFVEIMGGSIALESVAGRGSRFTVEVPSRVAPESELVCAPSVAERFVLEPDQPECRVLIVEDDPENGMILEQVLYRAGFSVRLARSGAAGIEEFREWRPQFIWMDLRMPELSGTDTTRRIRELPDGRKVKIAAMTASAFASEREEVMAAGMDDFVRKPYHAGEIFDCMVRQLGLRFRQPGE